MFNRGINRENIGEYDSALDYFYISLSLNPRSIKTYKAIARNCNKIKSYLNGIDFLNKASFRFPHNAELYAIKGDLYEKIKDYNNAIKEYDLAIKNDGEKWKYYENRAKIKILKGDIDSALNDYNGAVNLNPKNAKLYANRAFLYFEKGNFVYALKDYEIAIKLNPDKKHYCKMLNCMKDLINKVDSLSIEYIKY